MSDEKVMEFKITKGELNAGQSKELQGLLEQLTKLRAEVEGTNALVRRHFANIDKAANIGGKIHELLGDGVEIDIGDWNQLGGDNYFDEYDRGAGVCLVNAWVPSNYTC